MFKISRRKSVNLSIAVALLFIAVVAVIAVLIPFAWENTPYFSKLVNDVVINESQQLGRCVFFVWLYICFAIVEACCVMVFVLLIRVRKGLVFSEISVDCLRYISWLCMLLSLFLFVGEMFHPLMFVMAMAVVFLGLCLRVTKNVIELATSIKQENDFTI